MTQNGDTLIGWGNLNAISEFDCHGRLIFDARFPTGTNTYRAYLLPWVDTTAATTARGKPSGVTGTEKRTPT